MRDVLIRPLEIDDHPAVIDLGEQVFRHQHGRWIDDYRDELPILHAPEAGRHAAVAALEDGTIAGFVSWRLDAERRHGEIYLLAVSPRRRRQGTGLRLCQHAIAHMRAGEVEVVQIGTGGDPFHAPARALYERLGLTPVPVAVYLGTI